MTLRSAGVRRAITVQLPWAAAIAAGEKLIENRSRAIAPRHVGTRVAIHAGAGWSKEGAADPRIRRWWWGPDRNPNAILDATDFSYYFRQVIAVATVADCHIRTPQGGIWCCSPWGEGFYVNGKPAFHIVLADVVRVGPLGPVRGSLSVPWILPDQITDAEIEGQP